ncbi:hypothetical protein LSH36_153g03030 [Paralvinella palmiformis]|uniref:Uncharacterized protein n=1 Tax=Paralvinella palmiformis TaxID=53620 RepID=A0AAD9JVH7_9ANNE|nr:hypothetical protein LSH36_153g03030 [Paralvinella palmiformis]
MVDCSFWRPTALCTSTKVSLFGLLATSAGHSYMPFPPQSIESQILSFAYVAVSRGSGCLCHQDLVALKVRVSRTSCGARCHEDFPLPCGGDGYYSVYLSRGPYVVAVAASMDAVVYMGHVTSLEVRVTLASKPAMALGFPTTDDVDPGLFHFHYDGDDTSEMQDASLVNATQLHVVWQHTYSTEGRITLDIVVSNVLSKLSKKINITVLYPNPADLQVTLTPEESAFPSCIPEAFVKTSSDASAEISAVYVNTAVQFECLLLNGINLTFDWSVRKVADGNGRKQIEDIRNEKVFCEGVCQSGYLIQRAYPGTETLFRLQIVIFHEVL